jgi:hypothetical protein
MARPRKSKVKTSVYESDEIKAIAEDLIPEFHMEQRSAEGGAGWTS